MSKPTLVYSLGPIGDRVLLRPVDLERTGVIIAPPSAAEKPTVGEIVAVGEKLERTLVGRRVLYGRYTGTPTEVTGEELLLIRFDDLLAFLNDG